ncbi:hypothetical protein Mapa_008118 [Marchantia paleacea]|uniref:Uncharacterized protein n=1 Tax=Marchantia polymorpha TaxID=3197 RepID=A0A2R6W521_MARPO|nr:hypothetical protein Mapa_008118 [Marchantia paleacea]PTQ28941.1 hypothetical protein MARPO_0151s0015 [Marchantia polymorpha]|eukprot:PTQ28941.1 hypothetical protein MARPO_0151s0015 [Marchantia polymorpha]
MGQCYTAQQKPRERWIKKSGKGGPAGRYSQRESYGNGCFALVREQRARFYIIRRCITMLLCWHKYGGS